MQPKPLYTVAELATMSGLSIDSMRRMLRSKGVSVLPGNGGKWMVPLSEFQSAVPELWNSIVLCAAMTKCGQR